MKPKKLTFRLIDRLDGTNKVNEPYAIMEDLIERLLPDLHGCRIVLAWKEWKPNKDGQVTLGKCRKASDVDRSLHLYDFIIFLSESAWDEFDERQRQALVFHELNHCGRDKDKDGEPREDEDGNPVWRIVRHDMEEFSTVVKHFGLYKQDLAEFARTCAEAKAKPMFRIAEGQ